MSPPESREQDVAPVACTLGSAELARQGGRWIDLCARAGVERVATENGLRLSFGRAPGVADELRELVAVEQECCAWADWSVDVEDDAVVLCVSSTGEGVSTLHGMFVG